MKKLVLTICALALVLASCSAPAKEPAAAPAVQAPAQKALPAPVDTTKEGADSQPFAAASSSINATNLFEYFGRDDVLYIDLRDFPDYQKKHLRNFECVPYFAFVFDQNAGKDGKPQLFGGTVAAPVATYEESDDLLEVLFPRDKTIFFMCQSGGRVAQLLTLLNAKGYDMSKIYNVGGMGQYTAAQYKPYTVDAAELKVSCTYSTEGLTKKK